MFNIRGGKKKRKGKKKIWPWARMRRRVAVYEDIKKRAHKRGGAQQQNLSGRRWGGKR